MPFVDPKSFKLNSNTPLKLISVVPSLTELLFYFNLDKHLIARTKFCIHPIEKLKSVERIGGTKNLRIESILEHKPDLIIANKEENQKEDILKLAEHCNVLLSDINTVDDFYEFNRDLASIFSLSQKAEALNLSIAKSLKTVPTLQGKSVLYLIWKNPYMAAGTNTYINSVLNAVGIKNALNQSRYPELSETEISQSEADYIFLSSEPYPFKEKHIEALKKISTAKIILVDGEVFSWYSQRLLHASSHLNAIAAH